jgi:hypothetical protein
VGQGWTSSDSLVGTSSAEGIHLFLLIHQIFIEHLLLLDAVLRSGDSVEGKAEQCPCSHDVHMSVQKTDYHQIHELEQLILNWSIQKNQLTAQDSFLSPPTRV